MTKVAILFSGDPREFLRCYPTFKKNILEAASFIFDIFISTWDAKIQHIKNNIPNDGPFKQVLELYKPISYNREVYDQQRRNELYRETKIDQFQNYVKNKHKCDGKKKFKCRICGGQMVHNQIGAFYNIYRCNKLRLQYEQKHNFQYDYVIRNRFDNFFFSPLTEKYYQQVRQNNILIPEAFQDFPQYGMGINDQFALSIGHIADIYSDVYNHLYDIAMSNWNKPYGFGIPHLAMTQRLKKNNIDIEYIDIRYCLFRKIGAYKKQIKEGVEWKDIRV